MYVLYIYIYIYIERERDREIDMWAAPCDPMQRFARRGKTPRRRTGTRRCGLPAGSSLYIYIYIYICAYIYIYTYIYI